MYKLHIQARPRTHTHTRAHFHHIVFRRRVLWTSSNRRFLKDTRRERLFLSVLRAQLTLRLIRDVIERALRERRRLRIATHRHRPSPISERARIEISKNHDGESSNPTFSGAARSASHILRRRDNVSRHSRKRAKNLRRHRDDPPSRIRRALIARGVYTPLW